MKNVWARFSDGRVTGFWTSPRNPAWQNKDSRCRNCHFGSFKSRDIIGGHHWSLLDNERIVSFLTLSEYFVEKSQIQHYANQISWKKLSCVFFSLRFFLWNFAKNHDYFSSYLQYRPCFDKITCFRLTERRCGRNPPPRKCSGGAEAISASWSSVRRPPIRPSARRSTAAESTARSTKGKQSIML